MTAWNEPIGHAELVALEGVGPRHLEGAGGDAGEHRRRLSTVPSEPELGGGAGVADRLAVAEADEPADRA